MLTNVAETTTLGPPAMIVGFVTVSGVSDQRPGPTTITGPQTDGSTREASSARPTLGIGIPPVVSGLAGGEPMEGRLVASISGSIQDSDRSSDLANSP